MSNNHILPLPQLFPPDRTPVQNGITFVNILVTSLVLIVVAAPKGTTGDELSAFYLIRLFQVYHWLVFRP